MTVQSHQTEVRRGCGGVGKRDLWDGLRGKILPKIEIDHSISGDVLRAELRVEPEGTGQGRVYIRHPVPTVHRVARQNTAEE